MPMQRPVNLGERLRSPERCSLGLYLLAIVISIAAPIRSTAEEQPSSATDSNGIAFFEQHVRPILVEHCYECHSDGERRGGLSLDSKRGGRVGGDTGPAIVEGQPDQSLLVEAVRYTNEHLQMPPSGKLNPRQIAKIEKWISIGAPDPRGDDSVSITPASIDIEEGRKFWSFRPVTRPIVPEVKDSDWVNTPIDAFILSRLETNGVAPAPPADRRTLIRRITFDLIGLPPTNEEIDAFVSDESPDAIDKLVERLLASPQYGVRWGRHWLDVARYADSNGLDENLAFGNAWRYRDYVVRSFNDDKPFDQFLIEQIAGDLIPDANRETKTATGFLVLGAKVLAEPDREKLLMDTIDEQIDVTGKAFLGMTLGCVRCHDHKFDPIKQTDYYSLAAIFRSTKTFGDTKTGALKHWNETVFASESEVAKIADVDQEIKKRQNAAKELKNKAITKLREHARQHAVEYLVAATHVDLDMSLTEVAEIARPRQLHPRVLHHCRLHLRYHAEDPFFRPWHQFKGDQHAEQVENHYRKLVDGVTEAIDARKGPKDAPLKNAALEAARQAIAAPSGFLAVPTKPEHALDQLALDRYNAEMESARIYESNAPDLTAAMGVADAEILTSLPVHIRGSHLNLGQHVSRQFPEVMRSAHERPEFPSDQSGRLELARWMADEQHPLTSRVFVNRIWRWHFGKGIVASTENFGLLGDRPTHPELLDWLAQYFIRNGWSTKQMHRLIISSSSYQMSSLHPDQHTVSEQDPENQLYWRFKTNRLTAEEIRDSILATSGRLNRTLDGKTVPLRNKQFVFNHTSVDHTKYDSMRRAMYLPVIRNNLYSLFQQFDFPDPTMPTGSRNSTVVAPQALWMMNSDLVMDASDQLADELRNRSIDDRDRVEIAYQLILGRSPEAHELRRALSFIKELSSDRFDSARRQSSARRESAIGESTRGQRFDRVHRRDPWSLFCHSLYASNEFIYVR